MIFKDNLYIITASSEETTRTCFQIRLNASHKIFEAHFPGMPILPGACIVQMVAELVSLWLGRQQTLQIVRMSNLKFLSVISPDEVTELEVILELKKQEDGELRIAANVRGEVAEYSKMILTFAYGE